MHEESQVLQLRQAIQDGNGDAVKTLLETNPELLHCKMAPHSSWGGRVYVTPVLFAAEQGQFDIANDLVNAGANVKDIFPWENYGILHFPFKVIPNIINGVPLDEQSSANLAAAARSGGARMEHALMFGGLNPRSDKAPAMTKFIGDSPEQRLHSYDVALAAFLKNMIAKGADPNLESGNGITPLLKALGDNACPESAKALVKAGANVNHVTQNHYSVLAAAVTTKNPELIRF